MVKGYYRSYLGFGLLVIICGLAVGVVSTILGFTGFIALVPISILILILCLVLLEDETGGYVAIMPALPGCHTQGDTLAQVMENAKEAIDLYLETLTAEEKKDLLKEKVMG
jgi:predicted RNase H-like HicB family nuclease